MREKQLAKITVENEQMLKRLQEAPATYNVFNWESARRQQVKTIKNICYYPPSLLKKSRLKSRRKLEKEPNKQLYEIYQQSLGQTEPIVDEMNLNAEGELS